VWYPREQCPHCDGGALAWTEVTGPARIFAFAQVRRALHPPLKAIAPYVPVIVTFDDAPGIRLVSRWVNPEQAVPVIGEIATVVFEDFGYPKLATGRMGPLVR
jgi:uncharacterized OB-fold protein